jgi:hypothetical protein
MKNFWKAFGGTAIAVLLLKTIKCAPGRKRKCDEPDEDIFVDWSNAKFIRTQLIVLKRPGITTRVFEAWKRRNLRPYDLRFKNVCKYCDDSLELWEGANVSTFISEKTASAGLPPAGIKPNLSGGGDDIAFYSYNFVIDLPEPSCECDEDIKYPNQPTVLPGPGITIGILDTGIAPYLKNLYTKPVTTCLPGGENGWNFVDDNNNTEDDYARKHGSAVAGFIITEANKYKKQPISILPVKVHNKFGKSDLFSILCAIAYAANSGCKIINASFGFYSPATAQPPALLSAFVKKHIADNNIILVAAAGNVNIDETAAGTPMDAIRDLEINPFYPACLAKDFDNVIAVTTIARQDGKVSPSQNFSKKIVDLGVDCDVIAENDYRFEDPLGRGILIIGSSYATPVITGIIAQHYAELTAGMPVIDKTELINRMKNLLLIEQNIPLGDFVIEGRFAVK